MSLIDISIHTYICLFSRKVYRFYGEGLQSFEKCLDLEKICFTDPLNFGFAPLQVQELQRCGDYEEIQRCADRMDQMRTHLRVVHLRSCIFLKLPNCVNGYVTLT